MYILYENETAVNVRLDVKTVRTHVSTLPRRGVGRGGEGNLTGGCHLGASEVQTPLTWGGGSCPALLGHRRPSVAPASPCLPTARAYVVLCGGSLCC